MVKTVEIITSFYQDFHKFTWRDQCLDKLNGKSKLKFTVYKKDDSLELDSNISVIEEDFVKIPNIGRCDYAFIFHIIKNYDNLSDINVFTKINWSDQRNDFFGLLSECESFDFVDVGDTREIQIWDPSIIDSGVEEYLKTNNLEMFPKQIVDFRKTKNNGFYHHAFHADCLHDWYENIFCGISPPNVFWSWCHGPCFSVSKELIRRHPVTTYQYLLSRFLKSSYSWNEDLGKNLISSLKKRDVTQKEVMDDAAHHYHDNLLRFWRVLFTHATDHEKFKIKIN